MYKLADGVVRNQAIEINAVLGCNLACRGCSHASPILPRKSVVEPDALFRDLAALARVYRADHARVLGGEPLLHPDLLAVVDSIRRSGVAGAVRVVTNGVLLTKMDAAFWDAVDEVYVSTYPGFGLSDDEVASCVDAAQRAGTELRFRHYAHFRESYSEVGTADDELVGRIYRTCLIAHVWQCHTVVDGVFYKCPQSHFLGETVGPAVRDGIPIGTDDAFANRLLAYLNDPGPLKSCYRCLGAVGERYQHEQIRRPVWRAKQARPTEDMVDWTFLAQLEATPDSTNACIEHEAVVGR